MRWAGGGRSSSNIEDRRGGGGLSRGIVGGGLGTIVLAVVAMLFGVDPGAILPQGGAPSAGVEQGPYQASPQEQQQTEFVSKVLGDTEDTWSTLFRQIGRTYEEPTLVLFTDQVQSACGFASAATGPFYCPGDRKLYIDLSFYRELQDRFQAPGDFAQAYVIAHEVGHHVQTLLGISTQVHQAQQSARSEAEANALSVRLELQADCFAGVWAHHGEGTGRVIEPGDVEEALGAAAAVGDDRLQRQATGTVNPDSFTHGTSEQRMRWFRTGMESGSIDVCNTFR